MDAAKPDGDVAGGTAAPVDTAGRRPDLQLDSRYLREIELEVATDVGDKDDPLSPVKLVGYRPRDPLPPEQAASAQPPGTATVVKRNATMAEQQHEERPVDVSLLSSSPYKYKISVFTGDKFGAGTDSNVFIILYGEHGNSGKRKIDNSRNNFERGKEDNFTIECPGSLGRLERVTISHDDSGPSSGWFLDKVFVDDLGESRRYEFPCHRWLAKDEDDGAISRDLWVDGREPKYEEELAVNGGNKVDIENLLTQLDAGESGDVEVTINTRTVTGTETTPGGETTTKTIHIQSSGDLKPEDSIFKELLISGQPEVHERKVERKFDTTDDGIVRKTTETVVIRSSGTLELPPGGSQLAESSEIQYPQETISGEREVTRTTKVVTRTTRVVMVNGEPVHTDEGGDTSIQTRVDHLEPSVKVTEVSESQASPRIDKATLQTEHQETIITGESQPKTFTLPEGKRTQKAVEVKPIQQERRELDKAAVNGTAPSPNSSMAVHVDTSFEHAVAAVSSTSSDSGTGSELHKPGTGHFVVVAIDFGTTFSGYSFSFTRDPDNIYMMRKWEAGDPGVVNQKTPTTLLLKPDGTFYAFGFSARDFYHDLDPQEAKKWLYFEKFKMTLHYSQELNKETKIKAVNGKAVAALDVFTHALRFFRDHALQELSDQSSTQILNDDIRWVITVPAIWREPAKQFMREASYKAGIASQDYPDQLIIALEPEAASIYCRRLRLHQLVPEAPVKHNTPSKRASTPETSSTPEHINGTRPTTIHDNPERLTEEIMQDISTTSIELETSFDSSGQIFPLPEATETVGTMVNSNGTRYMVVDCGGGTVDITVHEMDTKAGKLKELYKATGGPYGSVGVDIEFEKLLVQIFGSEFMEAFKHKRPAGYVDLMMAFESRKRAATPYKPNPLNVSLPFSFIDYYKKTKANTVENAIRKYGDKDIKWSSQGMLRLQPEAMRRLFLPTLERINMSIGEVLNHEECKDVKFLFLVGGFAESPMLQVNIRREFGHLVKVIIPQDVGLTILKGAVMFGLDPSVVTVRKSRMTYGVGVLNRFIHGRHPKSKMVKREGYEWCTDIFDKFVTTDQSVALGDTVIRSYTPAKPGQKSSIIHIYSSERSNPQFITDKGVKKCGTLCLDLNNIQYNQPTPKRREIQTRMTFGDTYIKVTALDVATGKSVRASVDFLNK